MEASACCAVFLLFDLAGVYLIIIYVPYFSNDSDEEPIIWPSTKT
jgi:hypothetical protein